MRARHPHQGFTLIELMIVIAIIAVLVSLALPAYQDYTIRAKVTEGLSISAGVKTHIAETCMSSPNTSISLSTLVLHTDVSTYVEALVGASTLSCTQSIIGFQTRNTGAETEPVIYLVGTLNSGSMSWSCYLDQGEPRHVPANCRSEWVPPIT